MILEYCTVLKKTNLLRPRDWFREEKISYCHWIGSIKRFRVFFAFELLGNRNQTGSAVRRHATNKLSLHYGAKKRGTNLRFLLPKATATRSCDFIAWQKSYRVVSVTESPKRSVLLQTKGMLSQSEQGKSRSRERRFAKLAGSSIQISPGPPPLPLVLLLLYLFIYSWLGVGDTFTVTSTTSRSLGLNASLGRHQLSWWTETEMSAFDALWRKYPVERQVEDKQLVYGMRWIRRESQAWPTAAWHRQRVQIPLLFLLLQQLLLLLDGSYVAQIFL